jgi:hypothetical protein
MAIWASFFERQTTKGEKNMLKWIPTSEGVWHLGILVGHHLLTKANYNTLMKTIRGKLINYTVSILIEVR